MQDGDPTPKNPVPIKNTGDNVNLFDKDNANILNAYFSDNIITSNSSNRMLYLKCKPNTAYTITKAKTNYFIIGCTSKVPEIGDTVINKINGPSGNYDGTTVSQVYTTDSTAQYIVCRFYQTSLDAAISLEDVLASIKIEEGDKATPYSPYGCGNVNEKVQNKNLLPFKNQDFTVNNVRYYVQNGSLYFNGTSTSETSSNNTNFKNNFNFILEAGTYKISHKTGVNVVYIYNYDNDSSSLITLGTDTTSQTLTLTKKTKLYIGFYVYQKTFNNINTEIMIEQGSTAPSYVPHEEQNISFPLAQGQKLYEGSHPDDDEKVHHKRLQYIFTGTENWNIKNLTDENIHFSSGILDNYGIIDGKLCTHFINPGVSIWYNDIQGFNTVRDQYHVRFRINKNLLNDISTTANAIASFKSLLAEKYASGNPVILEFEPEEEQTEDFTEEQKTAWEEWKKARTYRNVTHISSEDETPANVEIEYVRDLETVINNLSN